MNDAESRIDAAGRGASSLDGKVVVVTGAGRGIGRATALHLAARGARVILNDLDGPLIEAAARDIRAAGGTAVPFAGSVGDWDSAKRLIDLGVERFGRLDGLVNNAGLHYQTAPWEETEQRLRALVEVNVLGVLFCGVHALSAFARQGAGAMVNITSAALLGMAGRAAYGASKGAVASMTYSWARDAADIGARVNAVAPLAHSRMTDPTLEPGDPGGAGAKRYQGQLPDPAGLAPLIAYLLSDASAPLTGRILRFNGAELSMIEPPRLSATSVVGDDWDDDRFANALREDFGPIGGQTDGRGE